MKTCPKCKVTFRASETFCHYCGRQLEATNMKTQMEPTAEQQAEHIANLCRELYKTNEGPRLLAHVMKEFPNPRRLINSKDKRWGPRATDYII